MAEVRSLNDISVMEREIEELEEEFSEFLKKAKENFTRIDLESDAVLQNPVDDETDLAFSKFIERVKENLSVECENENNLEESLTMRCASPIMKQISHSTMSESSLDRFNLSILRDRQSRSNDISFDLEHAEAEATEDFCRKRDAYSQKLYHYFNKKVFNNHLPDDMPVTWSDHLRTTAGLAHCNRKADHYTCQILLSTKVNTSFDRLRDTLLHEMCHAAVWIVNKSVCKHGPLWKTWASRCNLILPNVEVPTRCHTYDISYPFVYKCSSCQWKCGRHSKSSKLANASCPGCGSVIVLVKT